MSYVRRTTATILLGALFSPPNIPSACPVTIDPVWNRSNAEALAQLLEPLDSGPLGGTADGLFRLVRSRTEGLGLAAQEFEVTWQDLSDPLSPKTCTEDGGECECVVRVTGAARTWGAVEGWEALDEASRLELIEGFFSWNDQVVPLGQWERMLGLWAIGAAIDRKDIPTLARVALFENPDLALHALEALGNGEAPLPLDAANDFLDRTWPGGNGTPAAWVGVLLGMKDPDFLGRLVSWADAAGTSYASHEGIRVKRVDGRMVVSGPAYFGDGFSAARMVEYAAWRDAWFDPKRADWRGFTPGEVRDPLFRPAQQCMRQGPMEPKWHRAAQMAWDEETLMQAQQEGIDIYDPEQDESWREIVEGAQERLRTEPDLKPESDTAAAVNWFILACNDDPQAALLWFGVLRESGDAERLAEWIYLAAYAWDRGVSKCERDHPECVSKTQRVEALFEAAWSGEPLPAGTPDFVEPQGDPGFHMALIPPR